MKLKITDGWLFHRAGSWTLIVLGLGHILTHLLFPKTPEQESVLHSMRDLTIKMPGYDTNLLLFHNGFSLTMGGLLIFYGALNLILVGLHRDDSEKVTRSAILNMAVSIFVLVMSLKYFFIVPLVFSLVSLSFFLAFFLLRRGDRTH